MKMYRKIFMLILVLNSWLLASGCCLLTQSLYEVGVHHEEVNIIAGPILLSSDGSVAIPVNIRYCEKSLYQGITCPPFYEGIKYLEGSQQAVNCSVERALQSLTNKSGDKTTATSNAITDRNALYITDMSGSDQENGCGWKTSQKISRELFDAKKMLGKNFTNYQEIPLINNSDKDVFVPFEHKGITYKLNLHNRYKTPNNIKREWWAYPTLILLPAALAIDIVGAPVEFFIGLRAFNRAFN